MKEIHIRICLKERLKKYEKNYREAKKNNINIFVFFSLRDIKMEQIWQSGYCTFQYISVLNQYIS